MLFTISSDQTQILLLKHGWKNKVHIGIIIAVDLVYYVDIEVILADYCAYCLVCICKTSKVITTSGNLAAILDF